MGIRLLFLLFVVILSGLSILYYFIVQELEFNQKQIKDLYLTQNTISEQITDIVDYLVSQSQKSGN